MRILPILMITIVAALALSACSQPYAGGVAGTYALDAVITDTNQEPYVVGLEDTDSITVSEARFGVTMTFARGGTVVYGTRSGNTVRLFREGETSSIWYELTWSSNGTFTGTLYREDEGDTYIRADVVGTPAPTVIEASGGAGFLQPLD